MYKYTDDYFIKYYKKYKNLNRIKKNGCIILCELVNYHRLVSLKVWKLYLNRKDLNINHRCSECWGGPPIMHLCIWIPRNNAVEIFKLFLNRKDLKINKFMIDEDDYKMYQGGWTALMYLCESRWYPIIELIKLFINHKDIDILYKHPRGDVDISESVKTYPYPGKNANGIPWGYGYLDILKAKVRDKRASKKVIKFMKKKIKEKKIKYEYLDEKYNFLDFNIVLRFCMELIL